MKFEIPNKVWLILGASLDVSGCILVLFSLSEGGETLWTGVGLIASGSFMLRKGFAALQQTGTSPSVEEGSIQQSVKDRNVEPELKLPAPRNVSITSRGILIVSVWVIILSIFGVMAFRHFELLPPPTNKDLIESNGSSATATIHARETLELADGRNLHFIGYHFVTRAGSTVRTRRSVPVSTFSQLPEGKELKVRYVAYDPQMHYLPEITSTVPTQLIYLISGLLLIAAGFTDAQRRVHRRLVSSGIPLSGFIANVKRRGGVRSFLINYNVAGERMTLKATERNPELHNGQTVTLLYDQKNPGRAVLYRLAMYRARG